eukprot:14711-Amorphochlora_amoeboformis.AAC.1
MIREVQNVTLPYVSPTLRDVTQSKTYTCSRGTGGMPRGLLRHIPAGFEGHIVPLRAIRGHGKGGR